MITLDVSSSSMAVESVDVAAVGNGAYIAI